MMAALLVILPGHIDAGETGDIATPRIRLAALVDTPVHHAPPLHQPDLSLTGKWRAVRERMRYEQQLVNLCRRDPAGCPSDAATQFMAIVDAAHSRQGRALIGEINRAINLAVRPVSDERRHGADVWTSPLATLADGQGDCEDYVIAKLAALWAAGIPEYDTRFVIVRDVRAQEDHALALVRLEGRWLALDNRKFALIDAADLTYLPLFAIGGDTVRAFADRTSWMEIDEDGQPAISARIYSGTNVAPVLR